MGIASEGITGPDSAMTRYSSRRSGLLFDKYVLSGKTYTTANGAVVPDELQYYDGEMVHFYGECANVSAVNDVLAGSGYKAITLRHADGRQTAVAQLWSNRFTETSIGPYSAMFIVVMVVGDDAPPSQACIRADANGASSVLVMVDGSFDPARAVYENRARMFQVRLLDSTQVAIDVGRERLGTDKRPGTIDMRRNGRRIRISITNQAGCGVVRADVELADDPAAYLLEVARAAATAGIQLRALPRGTEYVYPVAARIGRAPAVSWQWRSDVVPQLQPVSGTVAFDASSEEGRMFLTWGFTPKVLGYIPNVRGVITGLADRMQPEVQKTLTASSGSPAIANVPLLRVLGGEAVEMASHLPLLRLVAQEVSARFEPAVGTQAFVEQSVAAAISPEARWAWNTTLLGSLTATIRKEVIGAMPDGLRINWVVTEGSFAGPGLEAVVLPGAIDWARIRKDGVGIVNVQACLETRAGERIYVSYGGRFDLGPDGYARALRDDFDPLLPAIVTPVFATAEARFAWLNRIQCIGVGRVDMTALRVEFDVYAVHVGGRMTSTTTKRTD
jgi:hypothetical protein